MNDPLLRPVTKRYTDRSTPKAFAFSFFCDQCGKEWRSTAQAFDPGVLESPTNLRVFRMLWNDQRRVEYEKANLEAICAFYYCPKCGRRVCMECFSRSEIDIAEICTDCLAKKSPPAGGNPSAADGFGTVFQNRRKLSPSRGNHT